MEESVQRRVAEVIFRAVDDVNEQLSKKQRLERSLGQVLYDASDGSQSLDSLGLVNLIVATEQRIEEEFGRTISFPEEWWAEGTAAPFKSIGTLADHIVALLQNTADE